MRERSSHVKKYGQRMLLPNAQGGLLFCNAEKVPEESNDKNFSLPRMSAKKSGIYRQKMLKC